MNGFKKMLMMVFAWVFTAGIAGAAVHGASIETGKALFNNPRLGTTGKTCNDCHPGGKGTGKAADKKQLPDIVNGCIEGALKGKALDASSTEMQSLILYIKSTAKNPVPGR